MPGDNSIPHKTESRRGRKKKFGTPQYDFGYFDAFQLYQQKLVEFAQATGAGPREVKCKCPSERARTSVLDQMGRALGNIGADRLRNIFSEFQRVRDWELPDCPVEHEELEATSPAQTLKRNFRECNERPNGIQPDTKPEEDAQ
jgi:hypothetical protein